MRVEAKGGFASKRHLHGASRPAYFLWHDKARDRWRTDCPNIITLSEAQGLYSSMRTRLFTEGLLKRTVSFATSAHGQEVEKMPLRRSWSDGDLPQLQDIHRRTHTRTARSGHLVVYDRFLLRRSCAEGHRRRAGTLMTVVFFFLLYSGSNATCRLLRHCQAHYSTSLAGGRVPLAPRFQKDLMWSRRAVCTLPRVQIKCRKEAFTSYI